MERKRILCLRCLIASQVATESIASASDLGIVFGNLCRPVRRKKRVQESTIFRDLGIVFGNLCRPVRREKAMRKLIQMRHFSHLFDFWSDPFKSNLGLGRLKMEPWMHRYPHGFGWILVLIGVREGVNAAPRGVLC